LLVGELLRRWLPVGQLRAGKLSPDAALLSASELLRSSHRLLLSLGHARLLTGKAVCLLPLGHALLLTREAMRLLALGHAELLALGAVAMRALRHLELLVPVAATAAAELLPLEAPHLRGTHLRRGESWAATAEAVEGRRTAAPAPVAAAAPALEDRRAASPVRSATAMRAATAVAMLLTTAAAAPVGATAAVTMLLTTATAAPVGAAAAIAMLFTATVPATGARICRDSDRQRGNARGEKQPAQHGKSPFEREKRSARCTVPTPKRMEPAL
jgi:hypothetical protein